MATVRPNVMKQLPFDSQRTGEINDVIPKVQLTSSVEVLESSTQQRAAINIQESDILVSGGRGLEDEKGFELLAQLAAVLGGKVSASRAVVDAGWIPYPHQVGQTGKRWRRNSISPAASPVLFNMLRACSPPKR